MQRYNRRRKGNGRRRSRLLEFGSRRDHQKVSARDVSMSAFGGSDARRTQVLVNGHVITLHFRINAAHRSIKKCHCSNIVTFLLKHMLIPLIEEPKHLGCSSMLYRPKPCSFKMLEGKKEQYISTRPECGYYLGPTTTTAAGHVSTCSQSRVSPLADHLLGVELWCLQLYYRRFHLLRWCSFAFRFCYLCRFCRILAFNVARGRLLL